LVESLNRKIKRIAWGITGSGDQMIETYSILVDIKNRTGVETMVFLSKEGERHEMISYSVSGTADNHKPITSCINRGDNSLIYKRKT